MTNTLKQQVGYNLRGTYCIKCGKEIPFLNSRRSKYCYKCAKEKGIRRKVL